MCGCVCACVGVSVPACARGCASQLPCAAAAHRCTRWLGTRAATPTREDWRVGKGSCPHSAPASAVVQSCPGIVWAAPGRVNNNDAKKTNQDDTQSFPAQEQRQWGMGKPKTRGKTHRQKTGFDRLHRAPGAGSTHYRPSARGEQRTGSRRSSNTPSAVTAHRQNTHTTTRTCVVWWSPTKYALPAIACALMPSTPLKPSSARTSHAARFATYTDVTATELSPMLGSGCVAFCDSSS